MHKMIKYLTQYKAVTALHIYVVVHTTYTYSDQKYVFVALKAS